MNRYRSEFVSRCRSARCRGCEHEGLAPVLDLGRMPPSDRLRAAERVGRPEARFPLELAFCEQCSLAQILETVPPDFLFGEDYLYFSSFSDALLRHSRDNAFELVERLGLGPHSQVVELASNDGYMLRNFVEKGIPVLGIDPAPRQAEAARNAGVPTICDFFGTGLADRLVTEGKQADLIIANNVVAHVADTNGFVAGIATLLKPEGVASIEFPYVRDLVDNNEFDTIYHEHLCYFSVTSADRLFRRHGLRVHDVRRLPIHGGSLRLYVSKNREPTEAVRNVLAQEHQLGIDRLDYYRDFSRRVQEVCGSLREMLWNLKREGKRLAAYGAAAKGAILLNALGVGPETLDFVVDRNVHKHGRYMPGVDLEIVSTDELLQRRPDYVLLLTWNFKDEILQQQDAYRARGGRFIIPIPRPDVV